MELSDKQKQKQEAIDCLRRRLTDDVRQRLREVDERLLGYIDGVAHDVSVIFGDENDRHSMWEVLCAAKFIRMFTTYHFNTKKVQFYIALREGQWERKGKAWRYISGGLRLPSTSGAKVYRWQKFQVFVLACVFGFYAWVDTHVEAGTKDELLDTEREKDGTIWDFRRMITEFIMYGPRKIDKTGLSSYIQLIFFLFGDFNSEIYSLAMTSDQSGILFDRTKFMLNQMNKSDEGNPLFRMTAKGVNWLKQYQAELRNSKIVPLTGGGKAPDGTNTELLNWDELGSSPYINGKSDMMAHVNVCQSSMGQRRQPLTFGTTTAGTITSGPFIEKLQAMHDLLLQELKYDTGEATPSQILDTQMCLLLEPDEYEKTEYEYILTSHALRRKINPMLSIVVQYDFYDREMTKARQEGDQKFAECVAKLFNVYQSGRVTKWITGDRIRSLQKTEGRRIDDCQFIDEKGRERWHVFCGMDFSSGDDLFALTYLAVDWLPSDTMRGRFFVDTDCWVLEKTMLDSPNRPMYEHWVEQGWLHVCPGEVFDSAYAINRIAELVDNGINIYYFGYDPAQSITPINNLKAWLQTIFQKRGSMSAKDIADMIQRMVIPVSQSSLTQNPRIGEIEEKMLNQDEWMYFSDNPLLPWCFGNCAVESKGDPPIRRIVKGAGHNNKIDPVHGLLDALYCFDLGEGKVSE
jgi:phage terminase large subunit-like protein